MAENLKDILAECEVAVEPKKNQEIVEVTPEQLADAIDAYYDADQAEKAAKKSKDGLKATINAAIAKMPIVNDKLNLNGNEHALQVVKKHKYSLNQTACHDSAEFQDAMDKKQVIVVDRSHNLTMTDEEAADLRDLLIANGRANLAEKIETVYSLNCKPDELRQYKGRISESVGFDLGAFINDDEVIQFSAKAKKF